MEPKEKNLSENRQNGPPWSNGSDGPSGSPLGFEARGIDAPAAAMDSPRQIVKALREQIAQWETSRRSNSEGAVSSGCSPLDRLLPGGGFSRGTIVEWLAAGEGSGAGALAVMAAGAACREGGAFVVLDFRREFYPPAAVRWGMEPEAILLVQAAGEADRLWALDQALRCPGVAATLAWLEDLSSKAFRRLQLAAEQGGGLGLLIRPPQARQEPSWAEVRLWIEPVPLAEPGGVRRLRVEVLRSRGGASGGSVEVEINDETRSVYLAPQLACPKAHARA